MALHSWARVYDDASLNQIVTVAARPLVGSTARNCLYTQGQILSSVPAALALDLTFLHTPPWEPSRGRRSSNRTRRAARRPGVPMLIIQGDVDPIVAPDVTARLVDRLCAEGENVELRLLHGVAHLDAGQVAAPGVVRWIADRFAGKSPSTNLRLDVRCLGRAREPDVGSALDAGALHPVA